MSAFYFYMPSPEVRPQNITGQEIAHNPEAPLKDMLTFQFPDKVTAIPRKPPGQPYTREDYAAAIGTDNLKYATSRLSQARNRDRSIQVSHLANGKNNRSLVLDEPNLIKAVTADMERIGSSLNENSHGPKEYKNYYGEPITLSNPDQILVIDSIIAGGTEGRPREELIQDLQRLRRTTKPSDRLNKAISFLRKAGFIIPDLTPTQDRRKGIQAVYVYMQDKATEEEYKKPPQSVKPPKAEFHSPYSIELRGSLAMEEMQSRSVKEKPRAKTPEEILAIKSAHLILSGLSNETFAESTQSMSEHLNNAIRDQTRFNNFRSTTLNSLFNDYSEARLKRFFKFNFPETLEGAWDATNIKPEIWEEEKENMELCNQLKEKGYDRKSIVQEVFGHFGIIVPPENA